MPSSNAGRLSALAYFLLLTIGVIFSLAGVTTKEIAATFAVDTSVIGYIFTLFTAGYSLAILGNGFFIDRINVKLETLAAIILASIGVAGASLWPPLPVFAVFILLFGVGMGILLSIAYFLVVNLYDQNIRASKVSILNFSFSVGAIVAPSLAGIALEKGISWQGIYQVALLLLAAAACGTALLRFDVKPSGSRREGPDDVWGAKVYLVGLMLLCYVLSEMIFTYWIVMYLMEYMTLTVAIASASLSIFWVFMAGGRLLAGMFIARVSLWRFILAASALAFAAFIGLLMVQSAALAMLLIAMMGLGYSALYSTILAYGTLQVPLPSSKSTTFFLTIGSVGGILAFLLSSFLKQSFGVTTTLAVAAAFMGAVTLLTAFAGRKRSGC